MTPDQKWEHQIRLLYNDAAFYKRQIIPSLIFSILILPYGVISFSILSLIFGFAGIANFFIMRKKSRITLEKADQLKAKYLEMREERNLF